MIYRIKYAYTSHMGKIRANNEDNFWCGGEYLPAENQGLGVVKTGEALSSEMPALAVFDGMGGESCGEMAAFLAAEELGRYHAEHKKDMMREPGQFLQEACREMNEAICRYCHEQKIYSMGTTLAMMQFAQGGMYACNLGDSRIYQSGKNGKLRRVSTDHVIGGTVFGKAPLTQYLGMEEENMVPEPAVRFLEYEPGMRCLLCSDGMTDMLSEGEIADILTREIPVEETVELLLDRTLKRGGRDNITIILCEISGTEEQGFLQTLLARCRRYLGGVG